MAKLLSALLRSLKVKNASSSGGGISGFTRDPKTTSVKRIGYVIGATGEEYEEPDVDLAQIKTAIQRDSYLMQTVLKYSELLFKSGYTITGKDDAALEYLNTRLNMMEIATGQPNHELWKGIGEDVVRYSNAFVVKARAKSGVGLPPGMNLLPTNGAKEAIGGYFRLAPETVTVLRDANGTIKSYQQEVDGGGDPIKINAIDMVHIKVNVPTGSAFGMPFLAPVLEDVRLLRKVEENIGLLLYRHIFPLLAYKVGIAEKGYESSDEEIDEISSVIDQMPTDGAIVLPERHSIEPIKIDVIDAKPYLDYFENRVFSGVGLSSVDFGRGDTANRNTADAMDGIKADRIKGWQQDIQEQIDLFIIDELLAEGGFDPIVNPEWDCDFVFNEIQLDQQIAKETHEINKFNNNIQTWEETRISIGMDPIADEARLQFQMIGIATAEANAALSASQTEAGANSASSKTQPQNQNGTTTKAESLKESARYDKHDTLFRELTSMYRQMEQESVHNVKRLQERNSSLEIGMKDVFVLNKLVTEKMYNRLYYSAKSEFRNHLNRARKDLGKKEQIKINQDECMQVVKHYIEDSLESLDRQLFNLIESRFMEATTAEKQILVVKSSYQTLEYKIKQITNSTLQRASNYAYVVGMIANNVDELYVTSEESACSHCLERSEEIISLKDLSVLDEFSIFYKIPPWHPNCYCEVHHKEVKN